MVGWTERETEERMETWMGGGRAADPENHEGELEDAPKHGVMQVEVEQHLQGEARCNRRVCERREGGRVSSCAHFAVATTFFHGNAPPTRKSPPLHVCLTLCPFFSSLFAFFSRERAGDDFSLVSWNSSTSRSSASVSWRVSGNSLTARPASPAFTNPAACPCPFFALPTRGTQQGSGRWGMAVKGKEGNGPSHLLRASRRHGEPPRAPPFRLPCCFQLLSTTIGPPPVPTCSSLGSGAQNSPSHHKWGPDLLLSPSPSSTDC